MSTAVDEQVEQDEPEAPESPVEPETGDVTEETGDEPEGAEEPAEEPAEPEGLHTLTEQETEKRFARIEKQAVAWRERVAATLGELALDLEYCPRCLPMVPGFVYPIAKVPIPDAQKVAVKLSLGELAPPDLRLADDAFECGKCGGYGQVLTGSRKESQKVAVCLECGGDGWTGSRKAKIAQLTPEQRETMAVRDDAPVEPKALADPWGRTIDDPLYGVMPGFERD